MNHRTRFVSVESLMDVGAGDEVGTPDEHILHCEEHDVLYRRYGRCLPCVREAGGEMYDVEITEVEA